MRLDLQVLLDDMHIYAYHELYGIYLRPYQEQTNIRDRGLPLLAARAMFNSEMVVYEDTRRVYPERRFIGYATMVGRLMVVVFCLPSDERIHIISFRKTNHREQTKFKNQSI